MKRRVEHTACGGENRMRELNLELRKIASKNRESQKKIMAKENHEYSLVQQRGKQISAVKQKQE
jgi:hypothetical protein